MEHIVGYQDYYSDKYEYSRYGKSGKIKVKIDTPPTEARKFFDGSLMCPFCKAKLKKVFLGWKKGTVGHDLYLSSDVYECPTCKWWKLKEHFEDSLDLIDEEQAICTDTKYYGIAKKYHIDDKKIPIDVLISELKNKSEYLYDINPYKLEELMQHILRGVYDCEVRHVGKAGDGGVDLMILESDDPILVQVKRRGNQKHVELVKGIREFVGTMFIEGSRRGIYVSTAEKFSRGSKKTANQLLENRKLYYFELVDYDKICAFIKDSAENKGWRDLIDESYNEGCVTVIDNEQDILQFESEGEEHINKMARELGITLKQ